MNQAETTFTNIYNENKTKLYRIKSEWEPNSLKLNIIEQSSAWFSEVSQEQIKNLANERSVKQSVYYENLKKYICNDHTNISVEVKNDQFILYQQKPNSKLRLKYFFIIMDKVDCQKAYESFLDVFNLKYTEALEKLKALQDENEDILKQTVRAEEHCAQFVELKRKSDLEMYSAFALTLNEKKQRIRFLTELLEEFTSGRKRKVKVDPAPTSTVLPVSNADEVELNLSEGYNTDDDGRKAKPNKIEPTPSTSKTDYDFLGGDSPPPLLPKRAKIQEVPVPTKDTEPVKVDIKISNPQYDADTDEDEDVKFNSQDFLDRM